MKKAVAVTLAVALAAMTWPATLAAAAEQARTGGIQGTAQDANGPLGNAHIQLRDPNTGQIVGSASSDNAGRFTFNTLTPKTYIVEIVDPAGNVLGTATTTVVAGQISVVSVAATAAGLAAVAAGTAGGLAGLFSGTSLLVIAGAAVVGVTAAVIATRNNASPSR